MAFFKNNEIKETKPVEQVPLNPSAVQRSVLIQKDLTDKKRELELMDKAMRSLQEQIENKRVLIASYEKNIIDNKKDYDRITSKHTILQDDIHMLEKELTLYNKGTHKDLLNMQDLENLNFLQAVETIKKFDEREKEYQEKISILESEVDKLKKLTNKELKPELPKFEIKIEEPKKEEGFFKKIFKKKKPEEIQTTTSEAKEFKGHEVVNKVVEEPKPQTMKRAVKRPFTTKNPKTTTKKSSKKFLNDKDKNILSKKGDKKKK